jgi:integrase
VLEVSRRDFPAHYPFILFLADSGARLGEATDLRWVDVDLKRGVVCIARSFSMVRDLGATKTGRSRNVELSTRLCADLAEIRPDLFGEDTLVFPSGAGGFIDQSNFRDRIFRRVVEQVLGKGTIT